MNKLFLTVLISAIFFSGCGQMSDVSSQDSTAVTESSSKVSELNIESEPDTITIHKKDIQNQNQCLILTINTDDASKVDLVCQSSRGSQAKTTLILNGRYCSYISAQPLFNANNNGCGISCSVVPITDMNILWKSVADGQGFLQIDVDGDGSLETQFSLELNAEGQLHLVPVL